jgi:hypothetical protein
MASPIPFTAFYGKSLNLTNNNALLAFQNMFSLYGDINGCYGIDIQFNLVNSSFCQALYTTTCSIEVDYMGFNMVIFDQTAIEAFGEQQFQYGFLNSFNGDPSTLTLQTSIFFDANFMYGMKSWLVNGSPSLNFVSSLGPTTTVSSTTAYQHLHFSYWSCTTKGCPTDYPLYEASTDLCYDVCPDGTYSNSTVYTCPPCYYTCETCSSYSVCTKCNATTNRYLNGSACLPNPGYFENSTAIAELCSAVIVNCSECDGLPPICTHCDPSYTVNSIENICELACTDKNCLFCPISN